MSNQPQHPQQHHQRGKGEDSYVGRFADYLERQREGNWQKENQRSDLVYRRFQEANSAGLQTTFRDTNMTTQSGITVGSGGCCSNAFTCMCQKKSRGQEVTISNPEGWNGNGWSNGEQQQQQSGQYGQYAQSQPEQHEINQAAAENRYGPDGEYI